MNATMSVDQYRKEVRDPAIKRFDEDVAFERALKAKGIGDGEYKKIIDKGGFTIRENFTVLGTADKPERQHIEDDHTEMVAGYLELLMMQGKVAEYTHTANETWDPGWKQKAKNQAKGVRSGIPDFVIVFKHAILFLELKKPGKGGVVSKTQKVWIAALRAVGGQVWVEVAYGFDEAKVVIDKVIKDQDYIWQRLSA